MLNIQCSMFSLVEYTNLLQTKSPEGDFLVNTIVAILKDSCNPGEDIFRILKSFKIPVQTTSPPPHHHHHHA